MRTTDEALSVVLASRTLRGVEAVITDREGPLGADVTFEGYVHVHLLDDELILTLPVARADDLLSRSLKKLARRHPNRRILLVRWDAPARFRRLREAVHSVGAMVLYPHRTAARGLRAI